MIEMSMNDLIEYVKDLHRFAHMLTNLNQDISTYVLVIKSNCFYYRKITYMNVSLAKTGSMFSPVFANNKMICEINR